MIAQQKPGSDTPSLIEVPLAPETAEWVRREAERAGVSPASFAASLVTNERLRHTFDFRATEQTFGPRQTPKERGVRKETLQGVGTLAAKLATVLNSRP